MKKVITCILLSQIIIIILIMLSVYFKAVFEEKKLIENGYYDKHGIYIGDINNNLNYIKVERHF